jgi:hypothetical protein
VNYEDRHACEQANAKGAGKLITLQGGALYAGDS